MPLPGAQWAARCGKLKPVVVISYGLRYGVLLLAALVPLCSQARLQSMSSSGSLLYVPPSRTWETHRGHRSPGRSYPRTGGDVTSSRKMAMALASLIFVPLRGR